MDHSSEQAQSQALQPNQDIVPYRVNEPQMVGPLNLKEVTPLLLFGLIGTALGQTNYSLVAGGAITIIQMKLSKNFPPGYLYHYLWFQGLIPTKVTKYLPDPIQRRFFQ